MFVCEKGRGEERKREEGRESEREREREPSAFSSGIARARAFERAQVCVPCVRVRWRACVRAACRRGTFAGVCVRVRARARKIEPAGGPTRRRSRRCDCVTNT